MKGSGFISHSRPLSLTTLRECMSWASEPVLADQLASPLEQLLEVPGALALRAGPAGWQTLVMLC